MMVKSCLSHIHVSDNWEPRFGFGGEGERGVSVSVRAVRIGDGAEPTSTDR